MEVTTTARHYDLTPAVKEYAESKVRNLTTYLDNIVSAHIVFALEKYRHMVEVTLHANGKDFASKGESENVYTSVDRVVDKLERQILKHKGKLYKKKTPRLAEVGRSLETEETAESPVPELEGEVIPADPLEFPSATLDEAVASLKDNGQPYSIFSNSDTKKLNVLYRREDGTFGLIEA